MKLDWQISRDDVVQVKALVSRQKNNPLVRQRRAKDLAKTKPEVQRNEFWGWMVRMRLTSIQRSGPNTPVAKFNKSEPFPLSYELLCGAKRAEAFIADALKNARGIRFTNKIPRELATNFYLLQNGEWDHALKEWPVSCAIEKEVANYIDDRFDGFGPKQSRNLLQALGLTRYEIPIDIRVTKWLNDFGFPIKLSATALADRYYYEFVSEGIRMLCAKSGVYPCILDATIFAMKDKDGWTDANVY